MKLIKALPTLLLFMTSCVPVTTNYSTANDKKLLFLDANYEPTVGMVQLYPDVEAPGRELENAVLPLNSDLSFRLTFDLLEENYDLINAKFIHCNNDWTPSGLSDLRFLDEYNAFHISSYEYSANTRTQYVKYTGTLPCPSRSGNYLIKVYRGSNEDDILFTRRCLVYENLAQIDAGVAISSSVAYRTSHQEITFSISYQDVNSFNPLRDFRVVLLQNHHWGTAITDLRPTLLQPDRNYLEYNHFNLENNFSGLNEFRFFDIRQIDYRGINVSDIVKNEYEVDAFLTLDKSRQGLAYTEIHDDLNGRFYLQNNDPGDSQLQSEYVDVHFELLAEHLAEDVFVIGRYNNWAMNESNRMHYDESTSSYKCSILLKQGYYDYLYWARIPGNELAFEGSKYQTDNEYEILFYYLNPATGYDELIGYRQLISQL